MEDRATGEQNQAGRQAQGAAQEPLERSDHTVSPAKYRPGVTPSAFLNMAMKALWLS